jgi:hypothetical protein
VKKRAKYPVCAQEAVSSWFSQIKFREVWGALRAVGCPDFNRYTKGQFREQDQIRLAALCRELDNRQVKWAVSNSNTFFVQSLFEGFHFREISNRREINLQSQNRTVVELLITNYETPKHLKQLSLFA